MTILAGNSDYFVEFESCVFSIVRWSDGFCKSGVLKGIAGQFRESVKQYGVDKSIRAYLGMLHHSKWEPLYKPERLIRIE